MRKIPLLLVMAAMLMSLPACILYDWPEGEIVMLAPFVNSSDITSINEAYSAHSNCPWGFEHRGIDFMISTDGVPFQAVCDGLVMQVEKKFNDGNGYWQVNIEIKYNKNFRVRYGFEPFSSAEADGNRQLDNIRIAKGDEVQAGETIGNLLYFRGGAHVDFSLERDGEVICPEPYFTSSAREAVLTILQATIPGARMCYE